MFTDKSLVDNEMLHRFCESINLQKNGCRTGQLKDFGPDMGIFSAILQKLGVESRTQAVIAAAKIESGQWSQGAGAEG